MSNHEIVVDWLHIDRSGIVRLRSKSSKARHLPLKSSPRVKSMMEGGIGAGRLLREQLVS